MTVTTAKTPKRLYELVDLNGKLAIYLGTSISRDVPERTTDYYVSPCSAREFEDVLGKVPWENGRNWPRGVIFPTEVGQRKVYVNPWNEDGSGLAEGWTTARITTEIKKPRDGKEYTYKWERGEWVKEWFPRCEECLKYHSQAKECKWEW